MNIYERLEKLNWKLIHSASRFDVYRKKNWEVIVSHRTYGTLHFYRFKIL